MYASIPTHRRFLILLIACTLFTSLLSLPQTAGAADLSSAPMRSGGSKNGMVRIYLSSLGNPSQLDITVSGSYTVNGQSTQSLSSGSKVTVRFDADNGKLTLTANGATKDMGSAFKLRRHAVSGENGLRIAQSAGSGNLYPGDLSFQVKPNGASYKLYTIAYVYIEDYLYGVVPYEMGNSSPLEALKAQAVTARTYTLRAMQGGSSRIYDVVDTTSDQVYRGTPSGNSNCKAAVDATKGIVSMNGSSLTATYYTASNGGQIESVKNLWGSSSYSYIKVKDDPYDLANPNSRVKSFTVNASGAQQNSTLGSLLNTKAAVKYGSGAKVTGVTAVTPHTPKYASPSRLYTKLDFAVKVSVGGSTKTGTLTFDIFNELETPLAMSNGSMKNELWTVTETSSGFKVEARRWGHGTGMSQRGAMQMANLGYTYDQIMNFYFEGCTRVQYSFTRSILSAVVPGAESEEEITIETAAPIEDGNGGTVPGGELAKVTTQSGSLNLRASASTSAKVKTSIPRNTLIRIESREGEWCRTTYNDYTGYVMASFLTFVNDSSAAPTPAPTQPDSSIHARVATQSGSLNLRETASTSAKVLTTIPRNQSIPIYDKGSNWCQTAYNGHSGYVMTKYLSFADDTPAENTPTQAPAPSGTVYARVTTKSGSLNLRETPSSSAKVLRTIPRNEIILLSEVGTVWCRTQYGGETGYVMTSFLTLGVSPDDQEHSGDESTSSGIVSLPVIDHARVTTQSGSLNLREKASTDAKVLAVIPRHATVSVHDVDSKWSQVTYQNDTGYVMNAYLTFNGEIMPGTPAPAPTATPVPDANEEREEVLTELKEAIPAQINSNASSLNLRSGPSKNHHVLCEMPKGDFLMVTALGEKWCKVEYEGSEGFCMREYLILPDGY